MFDDGHARREDPQQGLEPRVIQYRSPKLRKPNVTIARPDACRAGSGNLRMFRSCVLMGGIMTVLYVWIPLGS